MTPLEERFWSKVACGKPGECWPWLGGTNNCGYGTFSVDGRTQRAHRFVYVLTWGDVPPGLCVCHCCDNPRCVNPHHLWLGTRYANMRDCAAKGRWSCGDRNALTKEQVVVLKRRLAAGSYTQAELARGLGVTRQAVSNIKNGRSWAHV